MSIAAQMRMCIPGICWDINTRGLVGWWKAITEMVKSIDRVGGGCGATTVPPSVVMGSSVFSERGR